MFFLVGVLTNTQALKIWLCCPNNSSMTLCHKFCGQRSELKGREGEERKRERGKEEGEGQGKGGKGGETKRR